MKTKSTNPETQRKLERRNSVHPTTLKERQTRFKEALVSQYRANEGLGSRKRLLRRLKAENVKGLKALDLRQDTTTGIRNGTL